MVNEILALLAQGGLRSHGTEGAQHERQMESSGYDTSSSVTTTGERELGGTGVRSILRGSYTRITRQSETLPKMIGIPIETGFVGKMNAAEECTFTSCNIIRHGQKVFRHYDSVWRTRSYLRTPTGLASKAYLAKSRFLLSSSV